jgi:hypothetical protein
MRLVSIAPKPLAQSVEPALGFDLAFGFLAGQRVPLDFTLVVRAEDRMLLGLPQPTGALGQRTSFALEPRDNAVTNSEATWTVETAVSLSRRQLDYLEGLRSKNPRGDVVLQYEGEARSLVSKVVNTTLKPGPEARDDRAGLVGNVLLYTRSPFPNPFHSQASDLWVLSGDSGRKFIEVEALPFTGSVRIPSSDWLHGYAAAWNTTRFVVVELPQADVLAPAPTPGVAERVNKAIDSAKKASENVARGEWSDVLEDLRGVWELLRKDGEIASLLQRDGYTPDAVEAFTKSVEHQFALASKFMHSLDRDKKTVRPEIRASKEDALVCYSFAMSLLNLVARKTLRLAKQGT